MSERVKRILLIGGFVASVLFFAMMLYFLFFRSASTPSTTPTERPSTDPSGSLPASILEQRERAEQAERDNEQRLTEADPVAGGGITSTTTLTTGAIFHPTIHRDGQKMNYYNEADGRFYTIDTNGNVVALSDAQFPQAESVEWNRASNKAIIEFPDGSNVVYDFEQKKQTTLPSHWEDFGFSPVADELIAKSVTLDPSNRWLVVSSDDGSSTKSIQALGENQDKVDINWSPNNQVVAFAKTGTPQQGGLDRQVIYPVGQNQENLKGLVVEGLGFDSLWSPDGKQLLYSVSGSYSQDKPLLWIVDATISTMGNNRRSLGLNTWVDKCTWSSSSLIYCAVPLELPAYAGLGRSLYEDEPDALYQINLSTGQSTLLAIPATETSMNNLHISTDGSLLYFTNTSGQLEQMRLR